MTEVLVARAERIRARDATVQEFLRDCASRHATRREHAHRCSESKRKQERDWLRRHKYGRYLEAQNAHEMKKDLRKWFEALDADGSGAIDVDELEDPLIGMGLAQSRTQAGLSDDVEIVSAYG